LAATTVSLLVGVFVYITFWQQTKSDIFQIYPQSWMINTAKLLLCVTMMLTFPLPFFTCRELLIVTLIHPFCGIELTSSSGADNDDNDLQRPLLEPSYSNNDTSAAISDASSVATDLSRRILETATPKNWLLPDDDRQLHLPGHVGITFKLWLVATGFAIAAPSLGDILDLVGCASGTLIAFIIPALLSFRLEGYTNLAMLIFTVGGAVGVFGTYYSVKQLIVDLGGR
jgi:amino acid permease